MDKINVNIEIIFNKSTKLANKKQKITLTS